jgi:MOSC domain-containing protein YiiM
MSECAVRVGELFVAVARRKPMQRVDQAEVIADRGFGGCLHGRTGSRRQVLLVESETLAEFELSPGVLRENITTEGLRHRELLVGQHLLIGDAILQVTGPCEPCDRLEEIRKGLWQDLDGRRGTLCRVIKGGTIRRGDGILQTAGVSDAEVSGNTELHI